MDPDQGAIPKITAPPVRKREKRNHKKPLWCCCCWFSCSTGDAATHTGKNDWYSISFDSERALGGLEGYHVENAQATRGPAPPSHINDRGGIAGATLDPRLQPGYSQGVDAARHGFVVPQTGYRASVQREPEPVQPVMHPSGLGQQATSPQNQPTFGQARRGSTGQRPNPPPQYPREPPAAASQSGASNQEFLLQQQQQAQQVLSAQQQQQPGNSSLAVSWLSQLHPLV